MKCPNCGSEIAEKNILCANCGALVKKRLTPEEYARKYWLEQQQQKAEALGEHLTATASTPEEVFHTVAKTARGTASKPIDPTPISIIEEDLTPNPMADRIQALMKELDADRKSFGATPIVKWRTPTEPQAPRVSKTAEKPASEPTPAKPVSSFAATAAARQENSPPAPPKTTPFIEEEKSAVSVPSALDALSEVASIFTPKERSSDILHRPQPEKDTAAITADPEPEQAPENAPEARESEEKATETSSAQAVNPNPSDEQPEADAPQASKVQPSPVAAASDQAETLPEPVKPQNDQTEAPAAASPTPDTAGAAHTKPAVSATVSEKPTRHSVSAQGTMRFNVAEALASMPEQGEAAIPDIRIPEAYSRARYAPQDSQQWTQEAAQDEENDWAGFDPETIGWVEEETRHPLRLILLCIVLAAMVALAAYSVATSGLI